jgi:hypothetical protein
MATNVAVNPIDVIQDMDDIPDDDGCISDDDDIVVVENSPPLDPMNLSEADDEYFVVTYDNNNWVLVTVSNNTS